MLLRHYLRSADPLLNWRSVSGQGLIPTAIFLFYHPGYPGHLPVPGAAGIIKTISTFWTCVCAQGNFGCKGCTIHKVMVLHDRDMTKKLHLEEEAECFYECRLREGNYTVYKLIAKWIITSRPIFHCESYSEIIFHILSANYSSV
ncbi:hypothetical protein D9M68_772840 [compost metagenome]